MLVLVLYRSLPACFSSECKTSSFRLVGTMPFWPSASERSADVRGSVECGAGMMRRRFVGADVLGKVCLLLPTDVNVTDLCCSDFVVAAACGNCNSVVEVPYSGFDRMSLWGLVCFVACLISGIPGFTAGRGFNPAGGAPGGG
ncbi:hypothetical protein F511_17112 [Dorcoceras hygrometricum]|uniref:Uncharacterized protein n=1 Tax=Dorcoceras hygrometricum TaxID=472368 RepID=A0A2Z7CNA8_9LAMI|nr:hypothetical protein F511_17112 [Dorcoceras hygrometricum]